MPSFPRSGHICHCVCVAFLSFNTEFSKPNAKFISDLDHLNELELVWVGLKVWTMCFDQLKLEIHVLFAQMAILVEDRFIFSSHKHKKNSYRCLLQPIPSPCTCTSLHPM